MDKVVEEVEKVKTEWFETYSKTQEHIKAIGEYGKSKEEKNSLPRLNGIAQDGLQLLSSLQFRLDLLAPQLPTDEEVESARTMFESWKTQSQRACDLFCFYVMQRELLLGGGEESTVRRRNLQTKAGMTSAAESITESLRRTRQLMVQEVERNSSTLMTVEESTGVLKKAESEYKGHRSLLMRTRGLLSTMQRQDVMDRVILGVGFFLFSLAVLYVVSKRVGILTLQRKVTEAIKGGLVSQVDLRPQAVHNAEAPLDQRMRDEL
ncbi:putative vesicle transporter Sec20 [Senna tora]|uniref:Putative vesicle transporter Sec20 n=1 Tax=Senna tora TaxID=362788 RepID=A0A835CFY8_9FABA|nr:putative vesicle transporter Sec20 [Senna tora]